MASSPQSYQEPLATPGNDSSPAQNPAQPEPTRVTGDLPIKEHILMVNDLFRGEKYLEAMRAKIKPGDVVLEVGTGAGLLTCLAARLGAKRVYTVEQSPALYQIACKTVAANGLSDKVTLINANSRELQTLGVIKAANRRIRNRNHRHSGARRGHHQCLCRHQTVAGSPSASYPRNGSV